MSPSQTSEKPDVCKRLAALRSALYTSAIIEQDQAMAVLIEAEALIVSQASEIEKLSLDLAFAQNRFFGGK